MIVAKALVVGDAATGKTALIRRYISNQFSERHEATIGVDFSLKSIHVTNDVINLQLWDVAGQERFHALSRVYYRDAAAAFIVFDVTNRRSFEATEKWKRDIDSKVFLPSGDVVPVVLIANKCDLRRSSDQAVVSDAEIIRFARHNNFTDWYTTSARENSNVHTAFESVLPTIISIASKMVEPLETSHHFCSPLALQPKMRKSKAQMMQSSCC